MALGLQGAERRWGFDRPKRPLGRPIGFNGARCAGQRRGPGRQAREAGFPAQAQVAAWVRGEHVGQRARTWAVGRFAGRAERTVII